MADKDTRGAAQIQADQIRPGFRERMDRLKNKLKLGQHHAMERSALIMGGMAVVGVLVISAGSVSAFQATAEAQSAQAVYTTTFSTSKTKQTGEVAGIYRSADAKRALVLMKFDDEARMSYAAKDYEGYLMGSDRNLNTQDVATAGVKGEIVVFGSTGYIGVLLNADEAFQHQILDVTLRANTELAATGQESTDAEGQAYAPDDASFQDFDQWQVWVNAGADNVEHMPALDEEKFDPAKLYYEVLVAGEEEQVRAELDQKLDQMKANLKQIEVYERDLATTRADGLSLKTPKPPKQIAEDEVTGEAASGNKPSTLALKTDYTVPGGFNFPWRDQDVYTGYLDAIKPEGMGVSEYLTSKTEESGNEERRVADMNWELSNGRDLVLDYRGTETTMRPLVTAMNNLSQAYSEYETNKDDYQAEGLLKLLELELTVRDVKENSSVHGQDALMVLQ